MNEVISHIEFLLHTHNCVIVPGLGGFVVNTTPASRDGLSGFHAPVCELVFNRDLTYNDGLLVESFMRVQKISFEAAHLKINAAVKSLKEELREEKFVELGDLGNFSMIDDQRFSYSPKPFIRPEHYGLSLASIQPIIQLQSKTAKSQKQPEKATIWKKAGIGVAAAAVIAFVLLLFPIQDTGLQHQTAQIITESGLFGNKSDKIKTTQATAQTEYPNAEITSASEGSSNVANSFIDDEAVENQIENTATSPQYYIVAGVYEVREYADKMIHQLKSEGYAHSSIIEKSGRLTVFSESLSTIEEARTALNQLIKKHQNHRDAWIMKK